MPEMPTGLSITVPAILMCWWKAAKNVMSATSNPATHATARQRGDGGRPSGNSNGVKIRVSPSSGYQYQRLTHTDVRYRKSDLCPAW